MKIDWMEFFFNSILTFLGIFGILGGASLMELNSTDAGIVAFYGLLIIIIAERLALALRGLINSFTRENKIGEVLRNK